jgi:glycosyltransferase involved in cell wall biosynthesis
MKFSIIIPTLNEIKNLKRFLPQYQVLKGKFDYEIILGDSSSTDGTIEFARRCGARVEVTKERGIALGRNKAAAVATGEILVFLDAAVLIDKIDLFFKSVDKTFTDKRILAATPNVRVDPAIATWQDRSVHATVNGLIRFVNALGLGAGKGEAQIIRASAFKKVGGYNEKLVAAEDNDLFRRLARIGKVVFLKELQVFDDPRRYRKLGYPRVISQWILNQLSVIFRGKSYSKEWKRID